MKEAYRDVAFRSETLAEIDVLNGIIEEYLAQGFVLTVRQLYYQMVARGHIENTERSYKRLANLVNDARLAGLLDWDAIEDRTREVSKRQRWNSPREILRTAAKTYHEDFWVGQSSRVFVVVEKEALAGVLDPVCRRYDVPLLAARGYPSSTVVREVVVDEFMGGQSIVVLHLGDHDPSGIDMSRDLRERFELFGNGDLDLDFRRIALNMDQVEKLRPPENPAKVTDSRFRDYVLRFGASSWELDALTPTYLAELVEGEIRKHILNASAWQERGGRIERTRAGLAALATRWRDPRPTGSSPTSRRRSS